MAEEFCEISSRQLLSKETNSGQPRFRIDVYLNKFKVDPLCVLRSHWIF